jgi:hypothetical protein
MLLDANSIARAKGKIATLLVKRHYAHHYSGQKFNPHRFTEKLPQGKPPK